MPVHFHQGARGSLAAREPARALGCGEIWMSARAPRSETKDTPEVWADFIGLCRTLGRPYRQTRKPWTILGG
jgi:hypothetical protein